MCGIIGYSPSSETPSTEARLAFSALAQESRVRGMHAYGIASASLQDKIQCFKSHSLAEVVEAFDATKPTIFHARYSTSGDWQDIRNNQPIVVEDMAIALNGVVDMGTKEEMEKRWNVELQSDNDAEIVLQKMACRSTLQERRDMLDEFVLSCTGSFAGIVLTPGRLWAVRNPRRPLWLCRHLAATWFASTRDIFIRAGFPGGDLVLKEVTPGGVVCV